MSSIILFFDIKVLAWLLQKNKALILCAVCTQHSKLFPEMLKQFYMDIILLTGSVKITVCFSTSRKVYPNSFVPPTYTKGFLKKKYYDFFK